MPRVVFLLCYSYKTSQPTIMPYLPYILELWNGDIHGRHVSQVSRRPAINGDILSKRCKDGPKINCLYMCNGSSRHGFKLCTIHFWIFGTVDLHQWQLGIFIHMMHKCYMFERYKPKCVFYTKREFLTMDACLVFSESDSKLYTNFESCDEKNNINLI